MLSVEKEFYFFLPYRYQFSFLSVLAKTSGKISKINSGKGCFCLVSDTSGKVLSFLSLSVILVVGFGQVFFFFTKLRKFRSIHSLLSFFF